MEGGQQVVTQAAAKVTVAEMFFHQWPVLQALSEQDHVKSYNQEQNHNQSENKKHTIETYLMRNFQVFACRAMSRLEITEQISSRLWITATHEDFVK